MKFTVDVIYGGELLNDLKKSVRLNASQEINRHLFKLVFLCGKELSGENSTNPCNRRKVKGFLKRHRNDVKCINVEKLTEKLLDQEKLNLLTFEEFIAALSDAIILFAESWGSVCELGAFSASDSLARKMVVINDKQHINSLSFVSQGPIAKIEGLGVDKVIYTDNDAIFANPKMHDLLINCVPISKECRPNNDPHSIKLNSYIHEVLDIIGLFGPVSSKQISAIYNWVKGFTNYSFSDGSGQSMGFGNKIKPKLVLDVLELLEFVQSKDDYYLLAGDQDTTQGFLFALDERKYQTMRAKIVARKFKYRDWYGNESYYKNVQ